MQHLAAPALVAIAAAFAYADVIAGLVRQWSDDGNYSHGFLVAPLSIFFAWRRRAALVAAPVRPDARGLFLVGASLLLLVVGTAAADLFLRRISLVGVVAGAALYLYGRERLRLLAFPIAFLLLMIPLPAIVFNQLAMPLQLVASQAGEWSLRAAGVAVHRAGNVLELATMRLEVAEACSGIRSLMALITFAVVLAHVGGAGRGRTVALVAMTVPIAIGVNALRVAATGLSAHAWGPQAAEGLFHTFSGGGVFALAFVLLLALDRSAA